LVVFCLLFLHPFHHYQPPRKENIAGVLVVGPRGYRIIIIFLSLISSF
jgi:hypothetical protein